MAHALDSRSATLAVLDGHGDADNGEYRDTTDLLFEITEHPGEQQPESDLVA